MSVTAPAGFSAAGMASGIKASGDLDLSLVATDDARVVSAAGVFTSNLAAAAPVQVSRHHLSSNAGRAAAVVLSSGNANAATGKSGHDAAARVCELVGHGLGVATEAVLICQTGLIGIPFPIDVVERAIPTLVQSRSATSAGATAAATAIMTTDTVRKEVVVEADGFAVGGMAKGAAMLAPDMATMLAVLTTDADCAPDVLHESLRAAAALSFNEMTVDGCTSTNDTVLVLASGRSGYTPEPSELTDALADACRQLAESMAGDAEGATKTARIIVRGAASDAEAHRAARKVADSLLVKCSLNGADPYWGRVVSELGSAGVAFDIDRVDVSYGGVTVCRAGVAAAHDEVALSRHMAGAHIEIACELGMGPGAGAVLGTDLGHGYIDENRTTS